MSDLIQILILLLILSIGFSFAIITPYRKSYKKRAIFIIAICILIGTFGYLALFNIYDILNFIGCHREIWHILCFGSLIAGYTMLNIIGNKLDNPNPWAKWISYLFRLNHIIVILILVGISIYWEIFSKDNSFPHLAFDFLGIVIGHSIEHKNYLKYKNL